MAASRRIALIHATPLAMEPIQAALQRHWPQVHAMNLLDDSLSLDQAQAGRLTQGAVFVPEAMDDLVQGRAADHHRKIAAAARALTRCDAVLLAQFSRAAALPLVQAELPCPVFSSPVCAVRALMQRMTDA